VSTYVITDCEGAAPCGADGAGSSLAATVTRPGHPMPATARVACLG
jgi:hypothetical protein